MCQSPIHIKISSITFIFIFFPPMEFLLKIPVNLNIKKRWPKILNMILQQEVTLLERASGDNTFTSIVVNKNFLQMNCIVIIKT